MAHGTSACWRMLSACGFLLFALCVRPAPGDAQGPPASAKPEPDVAALTEVYGDLELEWARIDSLAPWLLGGEFLGGVGIAGLGGFVLAHPTSRSEFGVAGGVSYAVAGAVFIALPAYEVLTHDEGTPWAFEHSYLTGGSLVVMAMAPIISDVLPERLGGGSVKNRGRALQMVTLSLTVRIAVTVADIRAGRPRGRVGRHHQRLLEGGATAEELREMEADLEALSQRSSLRNFVSPTAGVVLAGWELLDPSPLWLVRTLNYSIAGLLMLEPVILLAFDEPDSPHRKYMRLRAGVGPGSVHVSGTF